MPVLPAAAVSMEVSVRAWHRRGFLACIPVALVVLLATAAGRHLAPVQVLTPLALPVVAGLGWLVLERLGLASRRRSLLLWPSMVGALMAALNVTNPHVAVHLLSLFVLAFLYMGLCQPSGTAWWGIGPSLVVYLTIVGLDHDTLLVRAPLAVLTWYFVCELPARLLEALRQQTGEMARTAATDPLTGLSNRAHLDGTVDGTGPHDALVLLDLDHFKRFNDTFGHLAGDDLLREFARCLEQHTRAGDLLFRYGGEEFLVVLPATSSEEAADVMRRLAEAWSAVRPEVTFSAGVAAGGPRALHEADLRLYRAKRGGRSRVVDDHTVLAESSLPEPTPPASSAGPDARPGSAG